MEKRFVLTRRDLQIPCVLTEPEHMQPQRIILSVHGLGGSTEDAIQKGIAEEMGIFCSAVLSFDFPSHGSNPLEKEGFTLKNCMDTLIFAANWLKDQYQTMEDLCIFATGFGAYVTLLCLPQLQELPLHIKLVIQTPSVRMHETLLSMLKISEQTLWAMERTTIPTPRPLEITYPFYESLQKNSALMDYGMPILILRAEEDAYIADADIRMFCRLNEQAKIVTIPGASHRFLEPGAWDMVLDLTRDWFEFEQVLLTDWE